MVCAQSMYFLSVFNSVKTQYIFVSQLSLYQTGQMLGWVSLSHYHGSESVLDGGDGDGGNDMGASGISAGLHQLMIDCKMVGHDRT